MTKGKENKLHIGIYGRRNAGKAHYFVKI